MSDPAVEAAQRQLAAQFGHDWSSMKLIVPTALRVRTEVAREALKPIRELHKPIWGNCGHMCCSGEECRMRTRVCGHDYDEWPCDTAKLVYTTEELDGE
ncbi:hypothetical protein H7I53_18135 [Mycolicibacterium pulveris]|uniref:Uncharacterized protein n=1 Tax=Mycolicibacterium pulveris TaxID=36813 RepID=A0A7I7UDC0_MYCPV|nr:hypothetical protein [Mycolicibacterium pulveris]MCV6982135.1 hypothetical protein [Mycolicibacterium pulveris]BBY78911.1 hypothetical protein MPUL_00690 [Mycolicibacterium pulveris]